MCGIVGVASARGDVDSELLVAQRNTLCHRGPDDAGVWFSADGRVGFAHQRLSIVDLSAAGHQPMSLSDSSLHITFNGEIYNFRELRRELESKGISFRSQTDTEVILAAYRAWGTDCLQRFVGMFALAIYDERTDEIFIARDRAGEKPLYYRHHHGQLSFASELKALLADRSVPRVMDPQAVEWFLTYGYVPADMCIVAGLHKLRPAHALLYDVGRNALRTWRYWEPPRNVEETTATPERLVDELDGLLAGAVKMQMLADVPVGILLSGGVDSSLVTAMAARTSPIPVHTFTISFPESRSFDEGPFARQIASHFGTVHTELIAEPASVELLPHLARQFDEPIGDSSIVPTYMVSKLIRQHATVALGGDGGDELFGGYPHYSLLLRQERPRRLMPRPVRAAVAAGAAALPVGTRGRNHLMGMADPHGGLAYANLHFDRATRAALVPFLRSGASHGGTEDARGAAYPSGGSVLRSATLADFEGFMADDILVKVDRASMLTSLEVRAPFLDHRIVEFAFGRVPDSLRATTTNRKILLRMLAARLLPAGFNTARKQGFTLPLGDWFKGEWGSYTERILLDAPRALFDRATVKSLIANQRKGYANVHRLFGLTMLELWRREYEVEIPGVE